MEQWSLWYPLSRCLRALKRRDADKKRWSGRKTTRGLNVTKWHFSGWLFMFSRCCSSYWVDCDLLAWLLKFSPHTRVQEELSLCPVLLFFLFFTVVVLFLMFFFPFTREEMSQCQSQHDRPNFFFFFVLAGLCGWKKQLFCSLKCYLRVIDVTVPYCL